MDYQQEGFKNLDQFVRDLRRIAGECERSIKAGRAILRPHSLHKTTQSVLHAFFWGAANAFMDISAAMGNVRNQIEHDKVKEASGEP